MQKSDLNLLEPRVQGTGGSLLVLVGFLLIGMAVGNVLAIVNLSLFLSIDTANIVNLLNQLNTSPEQVPDGWNIMMLLQGTVHFFSYLLPSLLFWFFVERKKLSDLETKGNSEPIIWLLAFLLVFVSIPFNSKFIEWNSAMTLPDAWAGVETWMRDKEDQLGVLSKFLTSYTSFSQFLIALFVMVLLPALGEEALFRGIIQRKLFQFWGNIHVAIFVSAAIFSAIHFQFYGFLPRMLLGALFGYLYYWSGSFWVAVFAHFINNGFFLLTVYLYNIKVLGINIEEIKTMPFTAVFLSAVLTFGILYLIRKIGHKQKVVNES